MEVLLVDDEPWVLIGLQRVFQWEKWGFHVCASVSSSAQALALIQAGGVDVVFSDIRMPEISGLQLLAKVHEINPELPFILVSGFADFSYAQQAIRQGAFDYLLKPVDPKETDAFLCRLSEHIKNMQLQKNLSEFERLLKEDGSLPARFPNASLPFFQAFLTDSNPSASISLPASCEAVRLEMGLHKCLYLCNTKEDLAPYLETVRHPEQTIGLSELLPAGTTKNPVWQAKQAFEYSFFTGKPGFFFYHATDSSLITKACLDIADSFSAGSLQDVVHVFRSLPCESMNLDDAAFLWNRFCLHDQRLAGLEKEFHYSNTEQLKQDFKDWNSLLKALDDMCGWYPGRQTACPMPDDTDVYSRMLQYIHTHYTEELYLRDLSEQFFINFTYCCELFKKNAGTTFTKYVTSLRLEKAAKLLLNSSFSVEEICFQSGYNDYSYFNKTFKKNYAITPFQYRKSGKTTLSEKDGQP